MPDIKLEMRVLAEDVFANIDRWIDSYRQEIENGAHESAPESEKAAYRVLGRTINQPDQMKALLGSVKSTCIGLIGGLFARIDGGFPLEDEPGECLYLDIVIRGTKRSVSTYSAEEEFWDSMPEDFDPFPYSSDEMP